MKFELKVIYFLKSQISKITFFYCWTQKIEKNYLFDQGDTLPLKKCMQGLLINVY